MSSSRLHRLLRREPLAFDARLRVPGVGVLDTRVIGSHPGGHALAVAPHPPVPVRCLHRRNATLERPDSPAETGTLLAVPGPRGDLRSDRLSFLGAPETDRRRTFVRVPTIVPVEALLGPVPVELAWRNGWTVDLSGGGLLLGGVPDGAPGQPIALRLALPDHETGLHVLGAVVRVTASGLRAVEMRQMADEDRGRIAAFLTARQRDALRKELR